MIIDTKFDVGQEVFLPIKNKGFWGRINCINFKSYEIVLFEEGEEDFRIQKSRVEYVIQGKSFKESDLFYCLHKFYNETGRSIDYNHKNKLIDC